MQETLTYNIFSNPSSDLLALSTSLIVTLLLGLTLAWVYKYKTVYTKEFILTLALLPSIIAMIIYLVNGNLGTGVAVAGTFSLVRFRSASASSKELLLIFTSTALGLATGMGFLVLAILFTFFISSLLLILDQSSFTKIHHKRRSIEITLPLDYDYQNLLESTFPGQVRSSHLLSISTKNRSKNLLLEYEVEFDQALTDKAIMDRLLQLDDQVEILLTKTIKKRKTL